MFTYFKNIASAATTIFEGLTITASHMLRKPITVQYPDRIPVPLKETMSPRYRGFLESDMKICTGCLLCMQACPIQCIKIEITKGAAVAEGAPPQRLISKFDIDIGKCMFCGLCVEPCPTGAIHFTKDFEKATYNIDDLMFKFVEEGNTVVPYRKGSGG